MNQKEYDCEWFEKTWKGIEKNGKGIENLKRYRKTWKDIEKNGKRYRKKWKRYRKTWKGIEKNGKGIEKLEKI